MNEKFTTILKCIMEGLILYLIFISPLKITSEIINGTNGYMQSSLIVIGQLCATFIVFLLGIIYGLFNSRLKINVDFKNKIYETNNTCCFFKNKTNKTSDSELEVDIFITARYKTIFNNKMLLKYIKNRKLSFYLTKNTCINYNANDSEVHSIDTLNGFDILLTDLLSQHLANSKEFVIPKTFTSKITFDYLSMQPVEKGERIYCKVIPLEEIKGFFNKIEEFLVTSLFISINISNHDLNLRIK
ncbi:MAG: hypothetical protein ACRDA0_06145 [Cetobacterium sp.]|uniref:hypothetical protein n=1 Tax=Cetobacterium sp. TaxID=2071632 RepID=UPI003F2A61E7